MYKSVCTVCGKEYDPNKLQTVSDCCGKPLFAIYDFDKIKFTRDELKNLKGNSMWKFKDVLPVLNEENMIDLGEGDTPMLKQIREDLLKDTQIYI